MRYKQLTNDDFNFENNNMLVIATHCNFKTIITYRHVILILLLFYAYN